MLPALFLSFLLAAFKRQQSLVFVASLAGALGGLLFGSIPAAIGCGLGAGCIAALLQRPVSPSATEITSDEH
jgi:predicted branched-subunit amino acid permease